MMTKNGKICFILLPGFSSDDQQVMGLKKILEDADYGAVTSNFYGPERRNDFTDLTIEECISNISRVINEASDRCEKIYGIGISLGGALLLEHAKHFENLSGIVSVGTPFRLKKRRLIAIGQFLFPTFYWFWRRLQKIERLRLSPIGANKAAIDYLEGDFLENLSVINTPVLFLHSRKDGVTDHQALDEYVPRIASEKKEVIYFPNGNHVVDNNPVLITDHALAFFGLSK